MLNYGETGYGLFALLLSGFFAFMISVNMNSIAVENTKEKVGSILSLLDKQTPLDNTPSSIRKISLVLFIMDFDSAKNGNRIFNTAWVSDLSSPFNKAVTEGIVSFLKNKNKKSDPKDNRYIPLTKEFYNQEVINLLAEVKTRVPNLKELKINQKILS